MSKVYIESSHQYIAVRIKSTQAIYIYVLACSYIVYIAMIHSSQTTMDTVRDIIEGKLSYTSMRDFTLLVIQTLFILR